MVRRTESAQFLPVGGMPPMKLVALVADGDMVVRVVSFDLPDRATGATSQGLIWNMFKVRDGRLAEHWDAVPTANTGPPPATVIISGGTHRLKSTGRAQTAVLNLVCAPALSVPVFRG
jgi:hypothetical protein